MQPQAGSAVDRQHTVDIRGLDWRDTWDEPVLHNTRRMLVGNITGQGAELQFLDIQATLLQLQSVLETIL